jgi:hypothetical protein
MMHNRQHSTESTDISSQQAKVIAALIKGESVTHATREAGVDRTTFYLWRRSDPAFEAELNRAKREQVEAIRAQLHPLVDTAVSTVREVLTGHDVPAAVRLKAAVTVLQAFGAQTPAPIGETDPEKIRQMQQFDVLACL